jgi:phage-related minor tail protein
MAAKKNEVVLTFAGDAAKLEKTFAQVGASSQTVSTKVGASSAKIKQGFAVASTAILAAGAAIGVGLAKIGSDIDSMDDKIRTGTGATGEAFAALQADARAVAKTVPVDLETVGSAIADVAKRTGETGKNLQDLSKAFIQLGKITGEDLPGLIAAGTRVFGDWSIAVADQVTTLDKLFRASQVTGIGVSKLADLVVQFGAPLRQLGFGFDVAVTMLGKWEKEGVNTELVLGGLKKALGQFSKAGQDPVKALAAFEKSIKDAGSTAAANKIAIETLGVKAGPDFAAAVREGRLELGNLITTVASGPDSIDKAAKATEDFSEHMQELKNNAFLALEPVASAVFAKLDEGVDVLGKLGEWAGKNTGTVQNLAIALGALAATVVAINIGMKVYAATMAVVKVATVTWTAIQWLLDASLWASGIPEIIIAVAALVAIIIIIATKTTWFQDIWRVTWTWVKGAAADVWDWISNTLWPGIQRFFDFMVFGFKLIPTIIKAAFSTLFDILTWPFRTAFNFISDAWNHTIGKLSWSVPDWVPFIGGNTISAPRLPKFHSGGRVPGLPGSEVLAVLQAGEHVTPMGVGSGDRTVIELRSSGTRVDDLLVEILARAIGNRGGNVQVVLGR